tara:strand:+ start:105 stop:947 length:843 start_codon:yes stop_codon:yes gene_type:complete
MNKYFCIIIIFLLIIYLIENKKINGGNNYYESNKISYEEVENMIKNKKVIIVGPAEYVMKENGDNFGKFIDSHDIVIKLNNMIGQPKKLDKYYGSRCDILISSFWPAKLDGLKFTNKYELEENYKLHKNTIIIANYHGDKFLKEIIGKFKNISEKSNKFLVFDDKTISKSRKLLDSYEKLPNKKTYGTGTYAIANILNMKPKTLYVTGITVYLDKKYNGYYPFYNNKKIQKKITNYFDGKNFNYNIEIGHNIQYEQNVYKNLINNNKTINVDNYIKKLIN